MESFVTGKQLTLSWVVVAVAALLLTACNPHPAEPSVPTSVSTPGSACAALKEIAWKALASAPPSPARAKFDAADRKAFAGSAFGYSGHSGRIGMARRMARVGAPTHEIMAQGRRRSAGMVAEFTRAENAERAPKWLG